MLSIVKGKKFPLESHLVLEGSRLESLGGIPHLIPHMRNPRKFEINDYEEGNLEFRLISKDEEGFYLLLIKVGSSITEILFNPALYDDEEKEDFEDYLDDKGNAFQIILINSINNVVETMRMIGLTEKISSKLNNCWGNMLEKQVNQDELLDWYSHLMNNYTTKQLWQRADSIGKFKGSC